MQAHVTPPPRQQARSSTQAALDAVREHPYTAAGAAAALLAACGLLYYRRSEAAWTGNPGSRQSSPTQGTPGQRIVLYGFWVPAGRMAGSVSPYTNKVEAFLRFNKLPYERKNCAFGSTPKGRLPFLQHGEDQVADSSLIIDYLENTYGSQLKTQSLSSPADAGLATALRHLAEDQYWPSQYHRMWTEKGKKWMHEQLMKGMPGGISKAVLVSSLSSGRRKQMVMQGVATNSEEEIDRLSQQDLDALAGLLGDKAYFFGDMPSKADAAVFGFLESHLYDGNDEGPLAGQVRKHKNLVAFVDKIRKQFYSKELADLKA